MSRLPFDITVQLPAVPVVPEVLDAQGSPILADPVTETVKVKAFAPREASESAEEFGGVAYSGGTVYGYPGTVIPPEAIVTIHGVPYLVDGELGDWNPAYTSGVELSAEGVQFSVKRAS